MASQNIIRCKWVLNGSVVKHEARMIAKRSHQWPKIIIQVLNYKMIILATAYSSD